MSILTFGRARLRWTLRKVRLSTYCDLAEDVRNALTTALKAHYFRKNVEHGKLPDNYLETESGKKELEELLYKRLDVFRASVVPWLNSIHPLNGSRILEIGCSTGSSTVALGEQGAKIIAIDMDEDALKVAQIRCEIYGIKEVEFKCANATDVKNTICEEFDFVLFSSVLEHMTHNERQQAIKASYDIIKKGGHIVVIGAPNRLWYRDTHTSLDVFFHWLSDEVAMDYARFTPREPFNAGFDDRCEESLISLARWGRGASFHEFIIALGDAKKIRVASSMQSFFGFPKRRYQRFIKAVGPLNIDDGFYDEYLNIALMHPLTE